MRFHPKRWNEELWVCSLRGHQTPAANVQNLRIGTDDQLGLEVGTLRLARCLRCSAWVGGDIPGTAAQQEVLPPFDAIKKPRRGHVLEEVITMRIIAVWRAAHAVVFALVAALLFLVRTNLAGWKGTAASWIESLDQLATETGRTGGTGFVLRNLERVSRLETKKVTELLALMIFYALLEGVEGVGLWKEKRWAEYLTVIATALLIPLEVLELSKKVTILRVGALIANVAVLIFLIRAKRLFGYGGGVKSERPINYAEVLRRDGTTGRAEVMQDTGVPLPK
jgi:uncharacterized membrane protein (DUF2068 family)